MDVLNLPYYALFEHDAISADCCPYRNLIIKFIIIIKSLMLTLNIIKKKGFQLIFKV